MRYQAYANAQSLNKENFAWRLCRPSPRQLGPLKAKTGVLNKKYAARGLEFPAYTMTARVMLNNKELTDSRVKMFSSVYTLKYCTQGLVALF